MSVLFLCLNPLNKPGMTHFHVFLNAPTLKELREVNPAQNRSWKSVICPEPVVTDILSSQMHSNTTTKILPPATFEEASRRISRIYKNIIFQDTHIDGEKEYTDGTEARHTRDVPTQGMHLLWFYPTANRPRFDTSQPYRANDLLHHMASYYR